MKRIRTHSEFSWSLIDPRPVLRYNEVIDEYIVYWNGIVMPHLMALNLAMERFGAHPTPTMKARLLGNYKRIYYTGGFGEIPREWEDCVRSGRVYTFLRNKMWEHLTKTLEGKDHAEVLGWFHYDRATRREAQDSIAQTYITTTDDVQ